MKTKTGKMCKTLLKQLKEMELYKKKYNKKPLPMEPDYPDMYNRPKEI